MWNRILEGGRGLSPRREGWGLLALTAGGGVFGKSLVLRPLASASRIRAPIQILLQVCRDLGILPHVDQADGSTESSSTPAYEWLAPRLAGRWGREAHSCSSGRLMARKPPGQKAAQRAWNHDMSAAHSLEWPVTLGSRAHTQRQLGDVFPTKCNRELAHWISSKGLAKHWRRKRELRRQLGFD